MARKTYLVDGAQWTKTQCEDFFREVLNHNAPQSDCDREIPVDTQQKILGIVRQGLRTDLHQETSVRVKWRFLTGDCHKLSPCFLFGPGGDDPSYKSLLCSLEDARRQSRTRKYRLWAFSEHTDKLEKGYGDQVHHVVPFKYLMTQFMLLHSIDSTSKVAPWEKEAWVTYHKEKARLFNLSKEEHAVVTYGR